MDWKQPECVLSGEVYVLRLSSIATAGAMTEFWRTAGVPLIAVSS